MERLLAAAGPLGARSGLGGPSGRSPCRISLSGAGPSAACSQPSPLHTQKTDGKAMAKNVLGGPWKAARTRVGR